VGGSATTLLHRPADSTLSVTKAARLLGVHPNTIRAWSDQGRLRYHRINERGDRRYRVADLQRFLASAEARATARLAGEQPPAAGRGPSADGGTGARHEQGRREPSAVPGDEAGRAIELASGWIGCMGRLTELIIGGGDHDAVVGAIVDFLHDDAGHALAAVFERRDGRLVPRGSRGSGAATLAEVPEDGGVVGRALTAEGAVTALGTDPDDRLPPDLTGRIAAPVAVGDGPPWGALLVADDPSGPLAWRTDVALVEALARQLGLAVAADRLRRESASQLHRAEALRRIATDIGSRLDLDQILASVVDHARVFFAGDRAGVFLRDPDGTVTKAVTRGLSDAYRAAVRSFPPGSLGTQAADEGRPLFATGYRDDPRAAAIRAAVIQEGYDTICAAPLFDDGTGIGILIVYHDRPHAWTQDELDILVAFAAQASNAIKNAQNYTQMVTWAAQLQSIQQLGARLSRFTDPAQIGQAIATELQTLIDYHNVRVYRVVGDTDLVPVAIRGQVGEYVDETPDLLRIKVGQGITGWVAAHKMPQNLPDAANDPRSMTVPGTVENLPESMLIAPMVFEDEVLGVIALSKLGLHQFADDDLRLLVIYASLAAQAMANADATARLRQQSTALERQLRSQRALLGITDAILLTLDPRRILDDVTEHLGTLIRWDNICIELVDASGLIRPIVARGVHAESYAEPWRPGEEGLATWVVRTGEAQLVRDELRDPRVVQFPTTGPVEGSIICVPLRGRSGVTGVMTVERLGAEDRFDEDEFELVRLFAAQVSVALQNAEAHRAVQIRAQTDALTGLLNQGTFQQWLARSVEAGERFGVLMLDLDNFKAVNDAMGHQAGNELLARIARTIVGASRETDRVFRYGGDEFAAILPATDGAGAAAAAERIRSALRRISFPGPAGGSGVTASIGIATFPADGSTADLVLLAADRACFVAKRSGRDGIATAEQGLALAAEFTLAEPTPVDSLAEAAETATATQTTEAANRA